MKLCLMVCLLLFNSKAVLSSTNQSMTECTDEAYTCAGGMDGYACHDGCKSGWFEINDCQKKPPKDTMATVTTLKDITPKATTGLIGFAVTLAPNPTQEVSTQTTTLPETTTPATTPTTETTPSTTKVAETTTTSTSITYCGHCPHKCSNCNLTIDGDVICAECDNGYQLNATNNSCNAMEESSDMLVPIIVGCVVGGVAIAVIVVAIVYWKWRRNHSTADVSGQCQVKVVFSQSLQARKPTALQPSISIGSDYNSGELENLPMAPPPPKFEPQPELGYNQLERFNSDEGLDYTTLRINPQDNSNADIPDSLSQDAIYMNTLQASKPANQNATNQPSSDSSVLEMNNEYSSMNGGTIVDNTQPPIRFGEIHQESEELAEQDAIYSNDSPLNCTPSPEANEIYEAPEGHNEQAEQSDIYENTEVVYQNYR